MRKAALFSLALCLAIGAPNPAAPEKTFCVPVWTEPSLSRFNISELSASLNNKPVAIKRILQPDSDLVILLVLDLSGDLAFVAPAKEALSKEMANLPPNVWVGVMHAQEGLQVLSDPSADREETTKVIQDLPVSGKAGLLDTVETAGEVAGDLLRKSAVRVALLYVTDSDITNYREDLTNPVINSSDPHDLSRRFGDSLIRERIARLERQLASQTAPLFILHLQYRASGLNQAYQNAIGALAESTAGYAAFCRSSGTIAEEVSRMISYIRAAAFLELAAPQKNEAAYQLRLEWKDQNSEQPRLAYRARIAERRK